MPTSLKQESDGYFKAAQLYQNSIDRLQAKIDEAKAKKLPHAVASLNYCINELKKHKVELETEGKKLKNYYDEQRRKQKHCMNCYHCAFKNGTYRCITLNREVGEEGTCEKWKEENHE